MKPRTASATSYGVRPPRLSLGVEFMWSTIVLKSHCVRYSKLVFLGRIIRSMVCAKLVFQLVKNKFYGTFGASVHNECKKQFFTG